MMCRLKKYFVLLLFAVATMLFASCERTCTCKTYRNGVVTGEAVSDMPDGISSCSDMDIYVETENGVVRETKCD